jgi:hypothetical protein
LALLYPILLGGSLAGLEVTMAATRNVLPRRNQLEAEGHGDELARLRAAVKTLADMVVAHGVMDRQALHTLLGDVVEPPASEPAQRPRRNPFAAERDADAVAAALDGGPAQRKRRGLLGRLFGRRTSPAVVAKGAASVEFTERTPKLPFGDKDGLYSDPQRPTELSFPPTALPKKPRPTPRPAADGRRAHAPARFCERCWRRVDGSGHCRSCDSAST